MGGEEEVLLYAWESGLEARKGEKIRDENGEAREKRTREWCCKVRKEGGCRS